MKRRALLALADLMERAALAILRRYDRFPWTFRAAMPLIPSGPGHHDLNVPAHEGISFKADFHYEPPAPADHEAKPEKEGPVLRQNWRIRFGGRAQMIRFGRIVHLGTGPNGAQHGTFSGDDPADKIAPPKEGPGEGGHE